MANFTIGSESEYIELAPVFNQEFVIITNASMKQNQDGYNSAKSATAITVTEPQIDTAYFQMYGDVFKYQINGTIMKDSLCIVDAEESKCKTSKPEEMMPFYLITSAEGSNLLGGLDGFIGLSPSNVSYLISYGQYLKSRGLIEQDSFSYKSSKSANEIVFGDYNFSAPQWNLTRYLYSSKTEDLETLWGANFIDLTLEGHELFNASNKVIIFEPTAQ